MLRLFILTFFVTFSMGIALAQPCRPVTDQREMLYIRNSILMQRNRAFDAAMSIAPNYCLTSIQAKELALLIPSERARADFLVAIYPNVLDPESFTLVFDAFRSFSMAIWVYHHTMALANLPVPNSHTTTPVYIGRSNCSNPINPNEIYRFKSQNANIKDDRTLARNILNLSQNRCLLSRDAIDLVGRISDESVKLDVLQRMIPNIYDVDAFGQAISMLRHEPNRMAFLNALKTPNSINPNLQLCQMSETDYRAFLTSTQKMSFDNDKVNHINTYMSQKCLTSAQIKGLAAVSSFDDSRLQIAQSLYDKCIDKDNFYILKEVFSFSSSYDKLMDYIRNR